MKHKPRARPPPTTRNIPELGISTGIPLTEYRADVVSTRTHPARQIPADAKDVSRAEVAFSTQLRTSAFKGLFYEQPNSPGIAAKKSCADAKISEGLA